MNFEKSKTSDPYRSVLKLANKINLKSCDKYVALSNLSFHFYGKIWKVIWTVN